MVAWGGRWCILSEQSMVSEQAKPTRSAHSGLCILLEVFQSLSVVLVAIFELASKFHFGIAWTRPHLYASLEETSRRSSKGCEMGSGISMPFVVRYHVAARYDIDSRCAADELAPALQRQVSLALRFVSTARSCP